MSSSDTSGFAAAQQAAQTNDATVLFIGLDQSQESEGHDRTSIALPGVQAQLVQSVAAVSKVSCVPLISSRVHGRQGPVVVVVIAGGCVDVSAIAANPNVWCCRCCILSSHGAGQRHLVLVLLGTVWRPGNRRCALWHIQPGSVWVISKRASADQPSGPLDADMVPVQLCVAVHVRHGNAPQRNDWQPRVCVLPGALQTVTSPDADIASLPARPSTTLDTASGCALMMHA